MIMHFDTIGQVPHFETTTCEYHKAHPGKAYAGCCCSMSVGWRKATPDERRANLHKAREQLIKRIAELTHELHQVDAELEKP